MPVSSNDWKPGTKRHEIAKLVERDMSAREAFNVIRPLVESQVRPWIFNANVQGIGRRPKEIRAQVVDLKHEVNRVFALYDKAGLDDSLDPADLDMPNQDEEIEDAIASADEIASSLPDAAANEKQWFLAEVRRIRSWIEAKVARGESALDEISLRPLVAAKTGLAVGIPARALLNSMCLHWSPETRAAAGVEDFDYVGFSQKVARDNDLISKLDDGEKIHKMAGIAYLLAKARIPVMLVGPSGTGKSRLAEQIAAFLDLSYGECPMTAGATPSWLLGSNTIEGFVTRPFLIAYSKGGVFNMEELDASDPNMLLVANNALAGNKLFNPMNGLTYEKSPNFIPVATANTWGLGANRMHTAREVLDAATIDRWRMGRIFVPIDSDLEDAIMA